MDGNLGNSCKVLCNLGRGRDAGGPAPVGQILACGAILLPYPDRWRSGRGVVPIFPSNLIVGTSGVCGQLEVGLSGRREACGGGRSKIDPSRDALFGHNVPRHRISTLLYEVLCRYTAT